MDEYNAGAVAQNAAGALDAFPSAMNNSPMKGGPMGAASF
jgi:hypothetical protein